MAATVIERAERFSALDGLRMVWIPVVAASTGIPTRAEIDAGTDLTPEVASWEGFEVEAGEIETPSLDRYTGSIPGRVTITAGLLRCYASLNGEDVREILGDGDNGTLAFMDTGDVPGDTMDLWPVRVNKMSKSRSGEEATQHVIRFTHNRLPIEDAVIPPAA